MFKSPDMYNDQELGQDAPMKVVPDNREKTLLEKALAVPVIRAKAEKGPTRQQVELALAWYTQRVSSKQAAIALGVGSAGGISSRMQTWMRQALKLGLLTCELADTDDE